jgi:hypothetical protein
MGVIVTAADDQIRLEIRNIGEHPVDQDSGAGMGDPPYGPSAGIVTELFQTMAARQNIANNSQHR